MRKCVVTPIASDDDLLQWDSLDFSWLFGEPASQSDLRR